MISDAVSGRNMVMRISLALGANSWRVPRPWALFLASEAMRRCLGILHTYVYTTGEGRGLAGNIFYE